MTPDLSGNADSVIDLIRAGLCQFTGLDRNFRDVQSLMPTYQRCACEDYVVSASTVTVTALARVM